MEGYDGRRREDLEILMRTGLLRSLGVQLSDGSLASARSTGQTWTLGAQCAYFTHASNYFRGREPELARRAEEAAYRALSRSGAGSGTVRTVLSRTVCHRVTGSATNTTRPTATTRTWLRLSWPWRCRTA